MTYSNQNPNSIPAPMLDRQITKRQDVDDQKSLLVNMGLEPTIALLVAGDRFEDFFDTIGISFETFCNELTGLWMFNYTDALRLAGVQTVFFFFSARVSKTLRLTHAATGAKVYILPVPIIHRVARKLSRYALFSKLQTTAAYLATPLGLFARELRREGCTAILCQEYEDTRFDVCVLLGKLMGLPVFATFQGGGDHRSRLEATLRPLTLRTCAGLIIASQTERERLCACNEVPATKLARIFNPMDAKNWYGIDRKEARTVLGIPHNARVVVNHGRIEINLKGLDVLLEAWEQICGERPGMDLRLLLVGTGSDADELRRRITTMQLRGVMWVNEFVRDRTAIRRYLSAADVYTLPSRYEGFPVAPIEAMACGLPVVAAEAPGVRDILEDGEASGGIVIPCGDAKALGLALGRLLDDEAWGRELGKRARQRAEECFSLEAIGKQLRDFLLSQKVPSSKS